MTPTNSFADYVAGQLAKLLTDKHVVVFYDPRREFEPFIDALPLEMEGDRGVSQVTIGALSALLARYTGSHFALKLAVEPNVAQDTPEPMLVYVPGVARDHQGSILMELEMAGGCYEPQLRRLARNVLRTWLSDGDIDIMLASESLTYGDVATFVAQAGGGDHVSLLKLVLGEGTSEALLVRWLMHEEYDGKLEEKHAVGELLLLVSGRLGLELLADPSLEKARYQTARYVLVNEFRGDLGGSAPAGLALVAVPRTKDMQRRVQEVATQMRRVSPEGYRELADAVESELGLGQLELPVEQLGSIDTFRFEERALLACAAGLIKAGRNEDASQVVEERGSSFWLDYDLARQSQWELCRLIASLAREIAQARVAMKKLAAGAARWVEAYTAGSGWHRADRAQRELEGWVSRLEEEPEPVLEQVLGVVRREHEELLEAMAKGYAKALAGDDWTVPGALHQTQVFPKAVEVTGGCTAYFLLDAFRYEMGAELASHLAEAEDLRLVPAIAALPTITPIGMAALLPGASTSFSIAEQKDTLVAAVEDAVLASVSDRMKFLRSRRPEARDIDLGELLQKSTSKLQASLGGARLVVVRSQSIDALGEMDSGLLARQIVDTLVANVARGIRKLAKVGVEYFVITADHGHQFSLRKEEDMVLDKPGGQTVALHRRCWVGRGGQTPAACVRVTGAELGYQTDLDLIFPQGLAVFKTGGSLVYHHGGISLQEMVIPVISLRLRSADVAAKGGPLVALEKCPEAVTNRTFMVRVAVTGDLFTQEPIAVKVVLIAEGREVGHATFAAGASIESSSGEVKVPPGAPIDIGMRLAVDTVQTLRVVAQDPTTDAILAQSKDIPVRLGI